MTPAFTTKAAAILLAAGTALGAFASAAEACRYYDEDGDLVVALDCSRALDGWKTCEARAEKACPDGWQEKKRYTSRGRSGWPNVSGEQKTLIITCRD